MIPAGAGIFLACQGMNHSREILLNVLPKVLRYRIPLYLPTEQLVFGSKEILVDFTPQIMPTSYLFDEVHEVAKNPPRIFTVELDGLTSSQRLLS